nr:protein gamete expressed 1 [Tanacetum cinerariifolium]
MNSRTTESEENIEEQAERLSRGSDHIHNSLSSIDVQTREPTQTLKHVEENANVELEQVECLLHGSFMSNSSR